MTRIWGWVAATVVMAAVLFGISQYDWPGHDAATGQSLQQRASTGDTGREAGRESARSDTTGKGERAQEVAATPGQLRLSEDQRRRVRAQLTGRGEARVQTADFTLSLGASVPQQVPLQDLPMELADTLGGYHGSKYLIVRDQVVIIDEARRIVALIPNVG